jgi:hypothetical protein
MAANRPRFEIWNLNLESWPLGFGIFFVLALLFLWPLTLHPNFVPFHPRSEFSDLLITHVPNAEYIRNSLARYGQWPLWNAQILVGQPFAADPLAGMWYPPDLLLLILPLPFAFNFLFALHFAWAGYGLFIFLRDEGLSRGPALLGSLAFMGTPKLVAHLAAGHASLVFAVAWTPWLLLAVRRAADPLQGAATQGSLRLGRRSLSGGALAGVCLALLFLADVRWAFYAAVLGAAFWVRSLWCRRAAAVETAATRFTKSASADSSPARIGGLWAFRWRDLQSPPVFAALAFAGLFFSLTAVLSFPLAGFILRSSRSALTLADAAAYSLPPRYLVGLVIPDLGGFHEWMTYSGVFPLMLAFGGVFRRLYFWIAAVFVSAAFSLGANFFLFPLLFLFLPGLGFLRVPPRAWFIVALGLSILAAHGAQLLVDDLLPRLARCYSRPPTSSPHPHTPTPPSFFVLHPSSFILALLLLTLADLLRVDATLLTARPRPGLAPAARWIAARPGLFRVYSPSYSLPLGDGLQHVDGVNPLQLASSIEFIEAAMGVEARGYSVTVPAFESDDPNADISTLHAAATPDAERLGMLNVKYVAAEFPVDAPGLTLVQTFGQTRVYENAEFRSRAWVEGGRMAEVREWSPNRITVDADGPGQLILSEAAYPGWEARVDGAPTAVETVDGLFRSVRFPEGRHEVVFEFRPRSLLFGAALTVAGLIALIWIWRWAK